MNFSFLVESIELDYGAWISPQGKVYNLQGALHIDFIINNSKLFSEKMQNLVSKTLKAFYKHVGSDDSLYGVWDFVMNSPKSKGEDEFIDIAMDDGWIKVNCDDNRVIVIYYKNNTKKNEKIVSDLLISLPLNKIKTMELVLYINDKLVIDNMTVQNYLRGEE